MDRVAEFKELRQTLIELGGDEREATVVALCAVYGLTLGEALLQENKEEAATDTASNGMVTISTKLDADAIL